MSDLAQIMKELGVSGGGGNSAGDNGAVKVEHVLVFQLSDPTDRLVRGIVGVLQEFGRHAVQSLRIVAIGSAVGIALWGTARLIEVAFPRHDHQPKQSSNNKKSSSNGPSLSSSVGFPSVPFHLLTLCGSLFIFYSFFQTAD
jgi:hypothetical protein